MALKQTTPIRPPPGVDPSQHRPSNTRYLYTLTAFVSLGAFLFGYDQGVMGVIVADRRWIDLMQPKNSCMKEFLLVILFANPLIGKDLHASNVGFQG